ncbi:hypothetical protein B0H14DRAFT_3517986 [Mycena olivaceomarginata]|nr:hypothetical protein B0H14DRAFT_3517986 [Mycena olivaceomarginata]
MGAVRTTFAMVAASIVRRKQLILRGLPDPYAVNTTAPLPPCIGTTTGTANQDTESRILQALEQASAHQDLSKSLLRLTYLLQQCLQNRNSHSAIELLMTQPALLDNPPQGAHGKLRRHPQSTRLSGSREGKASAFPGLYP